MENEFISNSEEIRHYAKRFTSGDWTFCGPRSEEKWCGACACTPEGKWNSVAIKFYNDLTKREIPICTGVIALIRGALKRKKNKETVHLKAETSNIELLF